MLNKQVIPKSDKARKQTVPERLGFRFYGGGVHTARTIMLQDLSAVLSYISNPKAQKSDYQQAIIQDNCLGKRSGRTRAITFNHLASLYGLDPGVTIFRTMLHFWEHDTTGRPLLAMMCASCRDPLLMLSAKLVLKTPLGTSLKRESLEEFIEEIDQDKFSRATLKSAAQNLGSSWTKSGHLKGRANKIRIRAEATPGSVSYALLLGFINGLRGQSLFESEYYRLLDCPAEQGMELARDSSRRGWIVFKNIGDVVEVQFPGLLTPTEITWLNEQNQATY